MSVTNKYFTIFFPKTAKATLYSFAAAGFSCLIAGILLLLYFHAKSHLPMNTTIGGIDVGNMTANEAKTVLEKEFSNPPEQTVLLRVDDITVASSSSELKAKYDIDGEILPLLGVPRADHTRTKLLFVLRRYFTNHQKTLDITYDPAAVTQFLEIMQSKVDIASKPPQIQLATSNNPATLTVFPGEMGRAIDTEETRALISQTYRSGQYELLAPVASTGAVLSEVAIPVAVDRGKKLVGKSISFTREGIPFSVGDTELVSYLVIPEGVAKQPIIDSLERWETQVNRPPQEPEFEYDATTLAVTKFVPPRNGLTLDREKTADLITQAIQEFETTTDPEKKTVEQPLPLAEQPPQTALADLNDLGIKERIGFGESYYAHSIPNRIYNVALATKRVSMTIVKPGEEYSFNKRIGDVSASTGYKSAYVIQGNRTVLGDGGGVCQVSTTLFRAVLNAGLDVTRRLPHSYRVSYYELDTKPGIDATVYSGETDFRFRNDTDQHLLVYGEADSKNLYMFFEIYGMSDGRTTEIVDHKTWNFRPAPPAQYIPDPSLPPGKTVQVDWAAAGISASFKHVIKDKDGQVVSENTYTSNYRPWSAKYLQGVAQ